MNYGENHWKMCKMRNTHCRTWNLERNSGIHEILRNIDCSTCILVRKVKNVENETKHCMTWNMARNIEKIEKWKLHTLGPGIWWENWHRGKGETHIVGHEIWWETPKNMWYETHTLVDLVYGEKTDKRGKGETNTVGHEIWRETLKKRVKWETHSVGHGIW